MPSAPALSEVRLNGHRSMSDLVDLEANDVTNHSNDVMSPLNGDVSMTPVGVGARPRPGLGASKWALLKANDGHVRHEILAQVRPPTSCLLLYLSIYVDL
jgi:hypothetical protein